MNQETNENQLTPFDVTESVISLYVDDTKLGAVIRGERDRERFQESKDRLEKWSKDWQLLFNVTVRLCTAGGTMQGTATPWEGGRWR